MTPEQHREICQLLQQIYDRGEDDNKQMLRIAKAMEAVMREARETKNLVDDCLEDIKALIRKANLAIPDSQNFDDEDE